MDDMLYHVVQTGQSNGQIGEKALATLVTRRGVRWIRLGT